MTDEVPTTSDEIHIDEVLVKVSQNQGLIVFFNQNNSRFKMKKIFWLGWRKYATLACISPLLVLSALGITLHFIYPPEKIRAEAIQLLSARLDRPLQIQDASVKLWPLGLELKGVELGAPKDTTFGRAPLLELPSLVFKADLSQLLQFKLRIEEIRIKDLKFRYEVLADGRTNLDGLSKPDTAPDAPKPIEWEKLALPGTFNMEALRIQNASIIYIDRKSGRTISLQDLNETMSLSLDSTLEKVQTKGSLGIASVSVEDSKLGLRKGGIKISLDHQISANLRKQRLDIHNIQLGLQNTEVSLKGAIDNTFGKNPQIALHWQSNQIQIAEVLAALPQTLHPDLAKIQASGQLQSSGDFISQGSAPQIDLDLKLQSLKLSHSDVPVKIQNLGFELKTNTQSASLRNFNAQIDGQKLSMELDAQNLKTAPFLEKLQLQAQLNLGDLMKLASKFTTLPEDYQVQGLLDANIQGSGPMDPAQVKALKMQGQIRLNQLRIKAPQLPEVLEYTGQIQVNPQSIDQNGNLKLGSTQMNQEAKVQNYMALAMPNAKAGAALASIKINAQELDIDKLMLMFGGSSSKEPSAPMTAYPNLPQNLNASLDVNVGNATAMGAKIQGFNAQLKTQAQSVSGSWKAGIFGGNLSQKIDAQILSPQNANIRTQFNALGVDAEQSYNFLADHLGESPLHRELKKLKGVFHGIANLRAEIQVQGSPAELSKSADGKIILETDNGRIDPIPQTLALTNALNKAISTLQTWAPGVKEIQSLKAPNAFNFHHFQNEVYLNKGNLEIKDFNYEQNGFGLLFALGLIGLDSKINMNLDYLVPKSLSEKVLNLQKSALDAAGKLNPLKGISLPQGLNAVPVKDQRVLLPFIISGTFASPVIQLDMNKMKSQGMDLKGALQGLLKAKADSLKALGLAKLNDEKAKLKAKADSLQKVAQDKANAARNEAQARLDAAKAEAERRAAEEKQKAQDKVKHEVQNKAGEALKKFGF